MVAVVEMGFCLFYVVEKTISSLTILCKVISEFVLYSFFFIIIWDVLILYLISWQLSLKALTSSTLSVPRAREGSSYLLRGRHQEESDNTFLCFFLFGHLPDLLIRFPMLLHSSATWT